MSVNERLIALAGMFQAALLVRQVAREGRVEHNTFEASIQSVLRIDSPSTEAVFGGLDGVRDGMNVLAHFFSPVSKQQDLELIRYVLGIAHLERKLRKDAKLLKLLSQGIERAINQAEHFGPTHENVIASLAGTYSETISTLQPRIVVQGEQGHLENNANADKVRALLLALMRATFLWRQKGGARWHLLFGRKKMMRQARELLRTLD